MCLLDMDSSFGYRQFLQNIGGLRSIGSLHESLKINLSDNSNSGNTLLELASLISVWNRVCISRTRNQLDFDSAGGWNANSAAKPSFSDPGGPKA